MIRAEKHSCLPPADDEEPVAISPKTVMERDVPGSGSICEVASARSNVHFYFDRDRAADFAAVLKRTNKRLTNCKN